MQTKTNPSAANEAEQSDVPSGETMICYCNRVTEQDIESAIKEKGAKTVEDVIRMTGAMKNSNCKVNNPKGSCCYSDIVRTFQKFFEQ